MKDAIFVELQTKWYGELADSGFEDIEDWTRKDRPLKRWTGYSSALFLIDSQAIQEEGESAQSTWTENVQVRKDSLFHNPDFLSICESLCKHGNHTLMPEQVKKIWSLHMEGLTSRAIGNQMSLAHVTVFRAQKRLSEWAELIESGSD